jgi:membrane-associated protein
MLSDAVTYLLSHPGLLVLIVFGAAAIEYVFPPFWGDTLMLAGSFVAGLQPALIPRVFAAALVGSCVGAMGAWWLGRRLGRASLDLLRRSERAQRVAARAERLYAAHGAPVVAFNRFLPGIRGFVVPLAGIGNMPIRRALVWSTVSNVLYCTLVVAMGAVIASRTPDLGVVQAHFRSASLWAAGLACLIVVALTAHQVARRRLTVAAGDS